MLTDPSVRHELRDGDPNTNTYTDMNALHLATMDALKNLGLDAKPFQTKIPVLPRPAVRNLTDDEKAVLISKTTLKAGAMFKAVGAMSYNSVVFLKGLRLRRERDAAEVLAIQQKKVDARNKVREHALRVLGADEPDTKLKVDDLKAVLRFFKVPLPDNTKRAQLVELYNTHKGGPCPWEDPTPDVAN
jgi:hypothetical protein